MKNELSHRVFKMLFTIGVARIGKLISPSGVGHNVIL